MKTIERDLLIRIRVEDVLSGKFEKKLSRVLKIPKERLKSNGTNYELPSLFKVQK